MVTDIRTGFGTDLVGSAGFRTCWDEKATRKSVSPAVQPVTSLASVSRNDWCAIVAISGKYANKDHPVRPIL